MNWIYSPDDPLLQTFAGCLIVFFVIILLTRLVGLRSFAKFTAYDFAFTVAIGSIISSILTSSTTIVHGAVAMGGLLALTYIFSYLQKKYPAIDQIISNSPLLLMEGNQILEENLKYARIDKQQLIAKLREANVFNFDQVEAVVLESTGDISVLHKTSGDSAEPFDRSLLEGVRKTPQHLQDKPYIFNIMDHPLLIHISSFIKFDEARFQEVLGYFETAIFEKKEILLRADQKCDTLYFVVEGCLRACFIDQSGMEKTVQFALENWWLTDFLAFHHQTHSSYSIQAVEPAQILCISYHKLQDLLVAHPVLEGYFRKVYEIGYGAALKRIKYIFDYSKEEIFFNFREDYPEFVNRVPQYMLATFLGLTPEYLSKLRTKKLS